jgi:hypothetical protein
MTNRRRLSLVATALLVLAGVVAPAQAQNGGGIVQFGLGLGGAKIVSEVNISASVAGQLTVSFHGDAGAGCAAYGLCPYSGTVVVRPGSAGLLVLTYRRRGRIGHLVALTLPPAGNGYITAARVDRSMPGGPAGTCADAENQFAGASTAATQGGSVTVRLLTSGGSLLTTRCAGPTDSDLAAAGPSVTIPLAKLVRGQTTIDLAGARSFAAHGFAGTIESTIVLRLGRPERSGSQGAGFPPGIKTERVRTVTERLVLTRVLGRMSTEVQGTANPIVCRLLDTCGLSGTLGLEPGARDVNAEIIAMGPASRPYDEFLTALGLSPGPRPSGISVSGFVSWTAAVRADLSQGGAACTVAVSTAEIGLVLDTAGSRLRGSAVAGGSWRTRCPGPMFTDGTPLLSTSVSRSSLSHGQFTIALQPAGGFEDDGYVLAPRGHVSLVLRRGRRITQEVITQPVLP